jgi:AcrR family transcriptional regulator
MSAPADAFDVPAATPNGQPAPLVTSPASKKANRPRDRAKTREELQFALLRIKNKGGKLTISAVAVEAGVTPGLIHNTYPDIAEAIRAQVGKAVRQQRDDTISELKRVRERNQVLRAELDAALKDVRRLASLNETLRQEVTKVQSSGNVFILPARSSEMR